MVGLPAAREPHGAVEHRQVVLERRGRVDVGVHARRRVELLMGESARDAGHFHHVLDPLGAERVGVHGLVGQGELVVEAVEMAHRGVDVHRLHRIAAGHVDAVEVLGELEKIPVALTIPDPPPAVEVRAVRRARHVDEDHVAPADGDCPLGVSRGDGELRGREPHLLHHEPAVHAHVGAARVRLAARRLQDVAGLLVQELDPDLLEHPHRPVVHRLHLLGGERLGRGVAVDGDLPRKLPHRRSPTPAIGRSPSRPARSPVRCDSLIGGHSFGYSARPGLPGMVRIGPAGRARRRFVLPMTAPLTTACRTGRRQDGWTLPEFAPRTPRGRPAQALPSTRYSTAPGKPSSRSGSRFRPSCAPCTKDPLSAGAESTRAEPWTSRRWQRSISGARAASRR